MRITGIQVYQHDLPVVGSAYTMANTRLSRLDSTIVQLQTDSGHHGWGETCPLGSTYQQQHALGARAAIDLLAPMLIGESIEHPDLLMQKMNQALVGHNYAKAALEIAVVDASAHSRGIGVAELLGGARTESVPAYYALGLDEPAATAEAAQEKVAQGYRRLQLKIGGRDPHTDVDAIQAVWERVGGSVKLVADANRGLSMVDFRFISNACQNIPIAFEQPCQTLREIRSIRRQCQHSIFLDENVVDIETLELVIEQNLCDGFGLKMTRMGGLQAMAAARDLCAEAKLPHTCDDTWGGDIIAAACVQLASTVDPEQLEGVWIAAPYIAEHYDNSHAIRVENGEIRVPKGPGLGINPNPDLFGLPVASY